MAAVPLFRPTCSGYSQLKRNLCKSELTLLKMIFSQSDEGQKGFLTQEDLKIAVISLLGYKPSKLSLMSAAGLFVVHEQYEVTNVLEKYGHRDGVGIYTMNLAQFTEAMTPKLINRDEDDEIHQTFMTFDWHCKGFVSLEDMKKVFSQVAPHIGHHRLDSFFRELDGDGDGRISYKDFDFMMKFIPLS